MKPGKIISKPVKRAVKAAASFAKQTAFETGKQVSQAAEEIVTQAVGASAAPPTQSQAGPGLGSNSNLARSGRDTQEIARLRQEIDGGSKPKNEGPKVYPKKGQDLETEMKKIRQQKVEKDQQEEDLLTQIKRQRQEEEMAAETDTVDALAGTGIKKAKGSAFAHQKTKGTKEMGRGKKH